MNRSAVNIQEHTRSSSGLVGKKISRFIDDEKNAAAGDLKKRPASRLSLNRGMSQFNFGRQDKPKIQVPKYQNSYRLEAYNPFNAETVDKIIQEVMLKSLDNYTYQPVSGLKLCNEITAEIRRAVNKKFYDRYKIVVQVSMIQRNFQSFNVGIKFLWDVERDNYSYYVFENSDIFAWCCVFGLYYE